MRELGISLAAVDPGALDQGLRAALPGKILGVSIYGPDRPISIWLDDRATAEDEATAAALARAHTPGTGSGGTGQDHAAQNPELVAFREAADKDGWFEAQPTERKSAFIAAVALLMDELDTRLTAVEKLLGITSGQKL